MRAIGASFLVALTLVSAGACSLFTDSGGLSDTTGAPDAASPDAPVTTNDATSAPVDAVASDGAGDVADDNPYRDAVLADHPIAYWPFDDAAGSSFAVDTVGGVSAAVIDSATFGVAGAVRTAVKLDGSGHLDAGDHFDFVGAAPFTIEFWAKPPPPNSGFYNVLEKRDFPDGGMTGYVVYFAGNSAPEINVQEWALDGVNRGGWGDVSATGFVHVVWTFDGKNVHLYADSIQLGNVYDNPGGPMDAMAPLLIGRGFPGVIDELAFYDHALSIERVRAHFERGHK